MPWQEVSVVERRGEFCELAVGAGANVRRLCSRFGISRKTGYKWLAVWKRAEANRRSGRAAERGLSGRAEAACASGGDAESCPSGGEGESWRWAVLADRSRRPHRSPGRSSAQVEAVVLAARDRHPAWGGRKLCVWLKNEAGRRGGLAGSEVPAPSTITEILRRHGRIDAAESVKHRAHVRFEHARPNDLWQMDFKGHFAAGAGRCHPLTVLDDHSRFAIGLQACGDERGETVQARLTAMFERYGLPERLLCDNGPPWGGQGQAEVSAVGVWLMRLGLVVVHGRPRHPQTQGKDERFHRTLQREVMARHRPDSLGRCQRLFDDWRDVYNLERPHQALDFAVPASRYRVSRRAMPTALPAIEYEAGDVVRRVQRTGVIDFRGRRWYLGKGYRGTPVAVRPTGRDGTWAVYFCRQRLTTLDFTARSADPGALRAAESG